MADGSRADDGSSPAWIPLVGPEVVEPEWTMEEADVRALREVGWSDEAILHACEVVAYFNFVNRTADGLGVSLEERWDRPLVPLEEREEE